MPSVVNETLDACARIAGRGPSPGGCEVIVVDDGSSDFSPKILARTSGIHTLRLPCRRGYGAALLTGFLAARGNLLGMLDGDGTYPPDALPQLVETWFTTGAELVVATRYTRDCRHRPVARRLGNRVLRTLMAHVTGATVSDPTSGMRVFHRGLLARMGRLPHGFDFGLAMTVRSLRLGLRIEEVAVPSRPRLGTSKVPLMREGIRFAAQIVRSSRWPASGEGTSWAQRPGALPVSGGI